MDIATYKDLHAQARRLTRRVDDADDLLHDALLAGLVAGREDPAWLAGVLRNQAALAARSAARRRRREAQHAMVEQTASPVDHAAPDPAALMRRLPPSARRLAVLLLHGLDGDEIRWILGISDTAFRQRLTRIRKALAELPAAEQEELRSLASRRDPARAAELALGPLRRALKRLLLGSAGLGTHDPDGHLVVVHGRAHSFVPGGN